MEDLSRVNRALDEAKRIGNKGGEYWMARDIQQILGYSSWENFQKVIKKARMACESAGEDSSNHFHDIVKMVKAGSDAMVPKGDTFLSRYACYLIAMNGESGKSEIGIAQTYFAYQTRKQEISDKLTDAERRLQLRDRVKKANRSLTSIAKSAGVRNYAYFHNAGYLGLYEMGLADIKKRKGLHEKEDLLDRAGRTELAANEFRITQAGDKIIRDGINCEREAINTHQQVGQEVRNVIGKIGGKMPEDLPAEEPIKELTNALRKKVEDKEIPQITN